MIGVQNNVPFALTRAGWLVGLALLSVSITGCDKDPPARAEQPAVEPEKRGARGSSELSPETRQELLVGYELLANTLDDESNLGKLEIFKKLTLDAPNKSIAKLMDGLSHVAEVRAKELEELRARSPAVTGKPAKSSLIGDAISDIAKDFGKSDMMSRNGGFDVRFVLVQAQATRMVAAMSSALARFDPEPERKKWLQKVARDYESYRADLVAYLGGQSAEYEPK